MPNKRIYLSPPHMSGHELELVKDTFDSNWIAPLGPQVDAFEQEMANYLGITAAAALSSGTAALHLALILAGVEQGDRVFCSSLTFSSSANVILYERVIPVFIDANSATWTMDCNALEKALATHKANNTLPSAVIIVDLYGQSADYDTLLDICDNYGVIVIEDAAEALGSDFRGDKCGIFGSMGILSFNGNKIITTSGGGMLVSNDSELVERARFLANQAREPKIHYEHKELGYNYRMSNILAAVGRGQLAVLNDRVKAKRDIFDRYVSALGDIEGVDFMPAAAYGQTNRWLTTLTIDENVTGFNHGAVITALEEEDIEARPIWKPMHMQPLYQEYEYFPTVEGDISKLLFENGLCLPSGPSLSENDQNRVIDIFLSLVS